MGEKISTKKKGDEFEYEVEELYRLLGFNVSRNITSAGSKQTDMVCEKSIPGSPLIRLYIECKGATSPISSSVVRQFIADYIALSQKEFFSGGVLVTKVNPSRASRDAISCNSCRVISIEELLDDFLNVSTTLQAYIAQYEKLDINISYIPLNCETVSFTNRKRKVSKQSLEDYIDNWLLSQSTLLILLGDFGTGKTTFLKRIKYLKAKEYIAGTSKIIPFFIPLRNFEAVGSLEKFVELQIQSEFGFSIPFERFKKFFDTSRLLLLLDGFDEIGKMIDSERREENFKKLLPILLPSFHSILTCRPGYFPEDKELDATVGKFFEYSSFIRLPRLSRGAHRKHKIFFEAASKVAPSEPLKLKNTDFIRKIRICDFSSTDIDIYVEKYIENSKNLYNSDLGNIRKQIKETYHLEDLARRPILLNLIMNTLPNLPNDSIISPSVIYSVYTEKWMLHDYSKGEIRRLIPPDKKKEFMTSLAWKMFTLDIIELHYEDLSPSITAFFHQSGLMLQFLSTDIQACSFLERNLKGYFRFSHKSFMEYFIASYLVNKLKTNFPKYLSKNILSKEIIFFLGDMINVDMHGIKNIFLLEFISIMKMHEKKQVLKQNLFNIFIESRLDIGTLKVRNLDLKDLRTANIILDFDVRHCNINNVIFKKCKMDNLKIESSNVVKFRLSDCVIDSIKLRNVNSKKANTELLLSEGKANFFKISGKNRGMINNSKFGTVEFKNEMGPFHFNKVNISSGLFEQLSVGLGLLKSTITDCTFDGLSLSSSEIIPSNERFEKTWLKNENNFEKTEWKNSVFRRCLFLWWDFKSIDLTNCKFYKCVFFGCRFNFCTSIMFLKAQAETNCRFTSLSVYENDFDKRKIKATPVESKNVLKEAMKINEREKQHGFSKDTELIPPSMDNDPMNAVINWPFDIKVMLRKFVSIRSLDIMSTRHL